MNWHTTLLSITSFWIAFTAHGQSCYFAFKIPADFKPRTLATVSTSQSAVTLIPGVIFEISKLGCWGVIEVGPHDSSSGVIVLVRGEGDEVQSFILGELPSSNEKSDCRPVSEVASALIEEEKKAQNLKNRLESSNQEIVRLKNDADVIGNISRIVTAEDDLEVVRRDIELTTLSKSLLEDRIVLIKKQLPPRSYNRRESELSTQLVELASVTRGLTTAQKESEAQLELNRKLKLIEATKNQHEELLRRELVKLRKERESFEGAVTVTRAPEVGE